MALSAIFIWAQHKSQIATKKDDNRYKQADYIHTFSVWQPNIVLLFHSHALILILLKNTTQQGNISHQLTNYAAVTKC